LFHNFPSSKESYTNFLICKNLNIFGKEKTNSTVTGPNPRSAQLYSSARPTSTASARPVYTAHAAHGLVGPARARGRLTARWHSTGRGPVPALARPTRRQGRERRLEQGGGGRPDSGVGQRRGGSGTAARWWSSPVLGRRNGEWRRWSG
jgi:hypothetical protein